MQDVPGQEQSQFVADSTARQRPVGIIQLDVPRHAQCAEVAKVVRRDGRRRTETQVIHLLAAKCHGPVAEHRRQRRETRAHGKRGHESPAINATVLGRLNGIRILVQLRVRVLAHDCTSLPTVPTR